MKDRIIYEDMKDIVKELKQEALTERLKGQTAFIWSQADSVEISKILCKFINKKCQRMCFLPRNEILIRPFHESILNARKKL